jgi:ferredoxin
VILPTTMLRHIFTSPLNMYLKDRQGPPQGRHAAMPNLMETELESFGASTVEDFTWKQLLDTDACTMCGRCTSVCPAHATGKPLDPREIVLKTGEVMAATGTRPCRPPIGTDAEITIGPTPVRAHHPRRGLVLHLAARPATRSARSTSRSSTRSSTCAATCR